MRYHPMKKRVQGLIPRVIFYFLLLFNTSAFFLSGQGSLVIIGGALQPDNESIYKTIIRLGGGQERVKIAILPAASISPAATGISCTQEFMRYGLAKDQVRVFPLAVKDDPSTPGTDESQWADNGFNEKLAREILDYTVVYFAGGDQERYQQTLLDKDGHDSPLLASIRQIYSRGGVLAGTSAGAAIMSNPMICGGEDIHPLLEPPVFQSISCPSATRGVKLTRGLGFLDSALVDQHFFKRGRLYRLIPALFSLKNIIPGIGIDEDTAVVYDSKNKTLLVIGRSGVMVVDISPANRQQTKNSDFTYQGILLHYLEEGDMFDLKTRHITINPLRQLIKKGSEYYEDYQVNTSIFGKDAIQEILTSGLADNRQNQAEGFAFLFNNPSPSSIRQRTGRGVRLLFCKNEQTMGYQVEINGKISYSVTGVALSIVPIRFDIQY